MAGLYYKPGRSDATMSVHLALTSTTPLENNFLGTELKPPGAPGVNGTGYQSPKANGTPGEALGVDFTAINELFDGDIVQQKRATLAIVGQPATTTTQQRLTEARAAMAAMPAC